MRYMIPFTHQYASLWPVVVSETEWMLQEEGGDMVVAVAKRIPDGMWRGSMPAAVCAGCMNFVTVLRDDPASALLDVVEENVRLSHSMTELLQNHHRNIEHCFDLPVEQVPADLVTVN